MVPGRLYPRRWPSIDWFPLFLLVHHGLSSYTILPYPILGRKNRRSSTVRQPGCVLSICSGRIPSLPPRQVAQSTVRPCCAPSLRNLPHFAREAARRDCAPTVRPTCGDEIRPF